MGFGAGTGLGQGPDFGAGMDLVQALAWVKDLIGELASGLDNQKTLTSAANR
jgi:hypothetical protein